LSLILAALPGFFFCQRFKLSVVAVISFPVDFARGGGVFGRDLEGIVLEIVSGACFAGELEGVGLGVVLGIA